jgi:hypothetical protein
LAALAGSGAWSPNGAEAAKLRYTMKPVDHSRIRGIRTTGMKRQTPGNTSMALSPTIDIPEHNDGKEV